MEAPALRRALTLSQATAVNLIDMVGIGPFVSLSFIAGAMQGPHCILAWLLGAALALLDGTVWAELGAKWPLAGGSYAFLQKLYGPWGRLMAFLFIWQTTIQAPLVVASGAIGFAKYAGYLVPMDAWQQKAVSGGLVLLLVFLLYRGIQTIGRLSIVFSLLTIGTLLAVIAVGLPAFNPGLAFTYPADAFNASPAFWQSLSTAGTKAVYCYLGYYNVCHLGAEIRNPERNIPRSIFWSIGIIAVLYLAMQLAVLGVLPWQQVAASDFVISTYFEHLLGPAAARWATLAVLGVAIASLFAVLLGYSRVLYAAAAEGNYFSPFARLHPRLGFPHVSLLVLGGISFVFSLLFRMGEVISAIVTLRILVQFVGQTLGLLRWHTLQPHDDRPWRMYLYPLAPLASIAVWMFLFWQSAWPYQLAALGLIVSGVLLYALFLRRR